MTIDFNNLIDTWNMATDGRTDLIRDLLFHLIPFIVGIVISFDKIKYFKRWTSKAVAYITAFIINVVLAFYSYVLAHIIIIGNADIENTICIILKVWYRYQDYEYFGGSLFICFILALIYGGLLRFIIKLILNKQKGCIEPKVAWDRFNRFFVIGTFCLICIVSITFLYKGFAGVNHLVINEVCSNNFSTPINEEYDVCDYVELYNRGEHALATDDVYLSDDESDLQKVHVLNCDMTNWGYMVVSLDAEDGFGIDKNGGETIYLSDATGNIIDKVKIPEMDEDKSFSRVINGLDEWVITGCTPGRDNAFSIDKIDAPVFSTEAGFYDDEFDLYLTADESVSIYYTLDGSEPTMESYLYQEPIRVYDRSDEPNVYRSVYNITPDWSDGNYVPDETPVDKAFVVRAIAVYDDRHISDVVTKSYFINKDKYKNNIVVSLNGNPNQIFGDDGIYVTGIEYDEWYQTKDDSDDEGDYVYPNFTRRGREHEVKVSLEYINNSDNIYLEQFAGLRIQGDLTSIFPLKHFSLFARKDYSGSKIFPEEMLGTKNTHSMIIRGSFANSVCQDMVKDRNIATQSYKPIYVFLNGEYWYAGSLLEKYNKEYFAEHYGVDEDNLILFKNSVMKEGKDEEKELVRELEAFIDTLDLSKTEDYEALCDLIDIQSYIDLMCITLYLNNTDRIDFYHNDVLWRTRKKSNDKYEDGRWRWALYDLDVVDDFTSYENKASLNNMNKFLDTAFFGKLVNNAEFRDCFYLTLLDLCNTSFSEENVKKSMSKYNIEISEVKVAFKESIGAKDEWEEFFATRGDYITKYCREAFDALEQ